MTQQASEFNSDRKHGDVQNYFKRRESGQNVSSAEKQIMRQAESGVKKKSTIQLIKVLSVLISKVPIKVFYFSIHKIY